MRTMLMCLVVSSTMAAPPDVPKTLTAKPGQLVRVTVKTDAEIGVLRNFTDEQAFFEELSVRKGERRFVFQAPDDAKPGTVYVVGWWTKGETDGVSTTITIPGGKVDPKPPPDVDPVRKDVSYRVVIVEETSDAANNRGAMLTNKALATHMSAKGHTFRVVDKDVKDAFGNVPADLKPVIDDAAKKGYPQVYLMDRASKLPTLQFAAPLTATELLKLLTDNGG